LRIVLCDSRPYSRERCKGNLTDLESLKYRNEISRPSLERGFEIRDNELCLQYYKVFSKCVDIRKERDLDFISGNALISLEVSTKRNA